MNPSVFLLAKGKELGRLGSLDMFRKPVHEKENLIQTSIKLLTKSSLCRLLSVVTD